MRVFWAFLFTVFTVQPMSAQDGAMVSAQSLQDVLDGLPGRSLQKLTQDPARFIEEGATLILGYGEGGSIGAQGIENFIALRRAKVRAREIRRFDLADLNGDGRIERAELDVLIATERASARGKLLHGFTTSDLNSDGVLITDERRQFGELKARIEVPDEDEEALKSLLKLDQDGDARLSLDEILAAIDALDQRV